MTTEYRTTCSHCVIVRIALNKSEVDTLRTNFESENVAINITLRAKYGSIY